MLDKFLCRHIHKKEITVGDIWAKVADAVTVSSIVGVGIWAMFIINSNIPLWTVLLSPVIGAAVITVLRLIAEGLVRLCCIIEIITGAISNIKIASCPYAKEKEEGVKEEKQ